jgi:hypothetical protein
MLNHQFLLSSLKCDKCLSVKFHGYQAGYSATGALIQISLALLV